MFSNSIIYAIIIVTFAAASTPSLLSTVPSSTAPRSYNLALRWCFDIFGVTNITFTSTLDQLQFRAEGYQGLVFTGRLEFEELALIKRRQLSPAVGPILIAVRRETVPCLHGTIQLHHKIINRFCLDHAMKGDADETPFSSNLSPLGSLKARGMEARITQVLPQYR